MWIKRAEYDKLAQENKALFAENARLRKDLAHRAKGPAELPPSLLARAVGLAKLPWRIAKFSLEVATVIRDAYC